MVYFTILLSENGNWFCKIFLMRDDVKFSPNKSMKRIFLFSFELICNHLSLLQDSLSFHILHVRGLNKLLKIGLTTTFSFTPKISFISLKIYDGVAHLMILEEDN